MGRLVTAMCEYTSIEDVIGKETLEEGDPASTTALPAPAPNTALTTLLCHFLPSILPSSLPFFLPSFLPSLTSLIPSPLLFCLLSYLLGASKCRESLEKLGIIGALCPDPSPSSVSLSQLLDNCTWITKRRQANPVRYAVRTHGVLYMVCV
jgi:hypothetical protein